MTIDDFLSIADEELTIDGRRYMAVVNRSSSKYRDLLPVLGRDDKLCEVFILKNDVKVGDVFATTYGESIIVLEIRECIDRNITHFIGAIKSVVFQRKNEVYK